MVGVRHSQTIQQRAVFLGLAVAGAAHVAAAFEHRDSRLLVGLFVTVAAVQLASAVLFRGLTDQRASLLVATTTVAFLGAWAASRTVGLAIGHAHGPERAAALDLVAVAAQVVVLFALAATRSRGAASWRRGIAALALALAVSGFASRTHPPADHHAPPNATTAEPALVIGGEVPPAATPPVSTAPAAAPAAPAGHQHSDAAAPHSHP